MLLISSYAWQPFHLLLRLLTAIASYSIQTSGAEFFILSNTNLPLSN